MREACVITTSILGELAPHPDQATAVLVVALKPRVHRCDAVTLPYLLFSPAYNVGGR